MTDNKSETEKVEELRNILEVHEAREILASVGGEDDDPSKFEDLEDDTAKQLASKIRQNSHRWNAHEGDELQGAMNANVATSSRAEWERRKNGDGS